jgi:hypothetical protein
MSPAARALLLELLADDEEELSPAKYMSMSTSPSRPFFPFFQETKSAQFSPHRDFYGHQECLWRPRKLP